MAGPRTLGGIGFFSSMKVVVEFPRETKVIENVWIPMSDGIRLAARIWLPKDAEERPVPALLECMPYRKRDFTRARDEPLHSYMAGHGYASIRLDLRGAGDSEGLIFDEYDFQEHEDIVEVLAWAARQPWCSGKLGMFGISWGGFNSLQVAARRPPGLDAIISICSTDDRYTDDVHYMGGCLLNHNLNWGAEFLSVANVPPDPQVFGPSWREQWRYRLENAQLFPARWMRHPTRDDYWRYGSVCEDFNAIQCPVYVVGGWDDGYTNAIPRLMAGLSAPRKALIGPWSHSFPHVGTPGPAIGFFQEMVRWWDYWLKGIDNGIMDEPTVRVWMEDFLRPTAAYDQKPGRWVTEESWPSSRIETRRLYMNVLTLGTQADPEDRLYLRSPQSAGLAGGDWYGFGSEGEGAVDQREDDGRSLVFESDPMGERMEILGAPTVTLELSSDRPVAYVIVRLMDVVQDGAASRVTFGVLNLTHRDGHASPEPLDPGQRYRVRVQLNDCAHAFEVGHTLRIAVSTAYWPMIWPTFETPKLTLFSGSSFVDLPVRPPRPEDEELAPFAPPERGPRLDMETLRPMTGRRLVKRDLMSLDTIYEVIGDTGDFGGAALARLSDIDLVVGSTARRTYTIHEYDARNAEAVVNLQTVHRRGDWSTRLDTTLRLSADAENFRLQATLVAYEGEEEFVRRQWDETIARFLL